MSDMRSDHAPRCKAVPVIDFDVTTRNSMVTATAVECLTGRQLEVLKLLALGYSVKEVAKQLFLSPKSVDSHKYRLMRKLGISDRVHLCRYAIRQGLIEP